MFSVILGAGDLGNIRLIESAGQALNNQTIKSYISVGQEMITVNWDAIGKGLPGKNPLTR